MSRYRDESVSDSLGLNDAGIGISALVTGRRPWPRTASLANHAARKVRYRSVMFASPPRRGASVPHENLVRRLHGHTQAGKGLSAAAKYMLSVIYFSTDGLKELIFDLIRAICRPSDWVKRPSDDEALWQNRRLRHTRRPWTCHASKPEGATGRKWQGVSSYEFFVRIRGE